MRDGSQLLDSNNRIAAVPAPPEMAPFADIPSVIWTAFLSAWALLFGLFIIFFAWDGRATLDVATAAFFALMTLGLPAALCQQPRSAPRERRRMIDTRTGPLPIGAAATQILLIPVGAVIGLTAFILFAM